MIRQAYVIISFIFFHGVLGKSSIIITWFSILIKKNIPQIQIRDDNIRDKYTLLSNQKGCSHRAGLVADKKH
jgi:hypothetical protein